MQVQIKFTTYGGNPLLGEFSPGDTARVSESIARHLVETKVARYMQPAAVAQESVQDRPPPAATAPAKNITRRQAATRGRK